MLLLSRMPFLPFIFSALFPKTLHNSPISLPCQMGSDRRQSCLVGCTRARSPETDFLTPLSPWMKQRTGGHVPQVNSGVKTEIRRKWGDHYTGAGRKEKPRNKWSGWYRKLVSPRGGIAKWANGKYHEVRAWRTPRNGFPVFRMNSVLK